MAESKNILIVDDFAEDREYLKHLLRKANDTEWDFVECDTAQQAAALLSTQRFDCVLLDYRLPDGTGIDILRRLRNGSGDQALAVVVLAAAGDERVAAATMKAGAQDYLPKRDLTAGALVHAIHNAIEIATLTRQRAQALAEKERLLALLDCFTGSAPVGFAYLDNDLRFQMVNAHLAQLNGLPVSEHIGRTVEEVVPWVAEQARAIHRHLVETGAPQSEREFSRQNPEAPETLTYWMEQTYPVFGPGRQMTGMGVVVTEVTEKKRAEQLLRENRERLAAALDASKSGTFLHHLHTGRVEADENLERLFDLNQSTGGHDFEQIVSRIHPDDRQLFSYGVEHSVRDGEGSDLEYRVVQPDGSIRWIQGKAKVLFDEQGIAASIVGACTDITQRKQNEIALRESERQARALAADLKAAMDAFPAVTFIARDPECLTALGSRATHELLRVPSGGNLSKSAPVGERPMNFRAMKDGREIPVDQLPLQTSARTGKPVRDYEFDLVYDDGSKRTLFGNTVPLLEEGSGGTIARGAVAAFVDVTQLKETEEALRRSNDELQRFAYVVSHDLQSPLRTICSMIELLERRCQNLIDGQTRELLDFIQAGTRQMSRLVADLLEYSRVSAEKPPETIPIDSGVCLRWALANLQSQIAESHASVTVDPALPQVMADLQLGRIFQNLIGNAIKYRGEKPLEIQVSAAPAGNQWVFAIRDNGIGFETEFADKIFGVFQRLHSQNKYEGTGIGLAICKKMVERYGGLIWAESTLGAGSTFYFSLPACANEPAANAAAQ